MFTMASTSVGSDPLTDILARLLAVPLREVYAVLLRAGVVKIVDGSAGALRAPGDISRGATAATPVATAAVPSACAHPTGPNGVLPSSWLTTGVLMIAPSASSDPTAVLTTRGLRESIRV